MAMEFKPGLMVPSTKELGRIIKHLDMASSGMLMEMCLKAAGKMIKLTAKAFMYI